MTTALTGTRIKMRKAITRRLLKIAVGATVALITSQPLQPTCSHQTRTASASGTARLRSSRKSFLPMRRLLLMT